MNKKTFLVTTSLLMTFGFVLISCSSNEPKKKEPVSINIEMVNIEGGTFTMGSPTSEKDRKTDETQFEVTLTNFRMSKYEITNTQFAQFLNALNIGQPAIYTGGSYPDKTLVSATSGSNNWGLNYVNNQWIPVSGYEQHPAIRVTWFGATEFANYVGGKLPTEAQWEYAARAGSNTPFHTGECLNNLQANYNWKQAYDNCSNTVTTNPDEPKAVGSYVANDFGLYDMHGNVDEWCRDWYGTYPTSAQTNPTGPESGTQKVLRGGKYYSAAS